MYKEIKKEVAQKQTKANKQIDEIRNGLTFSALNEFMFFFFLCFCHLFLPNTFSSRISFLIGVLVSSLLKIGLTR